MPSASATADAVVVDTDVASTLLRGTLPVAIADQLAGVTLCVAFVTVGELFRGAVHAGWGERRTGDLRHWLEHILVLPADATVGRRWGELTGRALRAGRPLPANDAWIAACCLVYEAPLATLNVRDFDRIDGLRLLTAE